MKHYIFIITLIMIFAPVISIGQESEPGSRKKIIVLGTVRDINNNPVEDAKIYVDSIYTGKSTNGLGKFRIKISSSAKNLIVISSEHGYGKAEIRDDSILNIILNEDVKTLDTFLAKNTKLYGASRIRRLDKMNTYNDIYQMIRQEVPGVLVSGKSIVIQQQNSFFGSSEPLFVVDGIRVNSIDFINPRDVKSIQLLKGSNAVIYGIEGANGVISITLLHGGEK